MSANLMELARHNVVSWKSDEKPGLWVNWLNALLAVILAAASAFAMHLRDHHRGLFTGTSLAGIVIFVVLCFVVVALITFAKMKEEAWPVFAAFALGVVTALLFVWLVWDNQHTLGAFFVGIVTFAVIGGCIVGIAFTQWWPHGRDTWNRDQLAEQHTAA